MKLASKGSHRLSGMKLRGQLGLALALTTLALGADAAGLGRLNLMSGLGQPLRAEIDLTSVARDEAGSLSARLAGAEAFTQANIEYGASLSGLRFSVQRRANGQPYVLVTSNQIVNEPYLDLLVELTWSSGRLVREYTMLLDPPETRIARRETEPGPVVQAQAPVSSGATTTTTATTTQTTSSRRAATDAVVAAPRVSRSAPRIASSNDSGSREVTGGEYRVQPGDTAISIARSNKPDNVSLEQMLAALYQGNAQAFAGNINRLLAGATVRIPDAASAQAVDRADARRIIVAQSSNFGSYRDRVARAATEVPASRSAGSQASGRLTTRVEDSAAPGAAKDRLELSRVDAAKAGPDAGKGSPSAARGTLNAPAIDEIAAKERELQETKARLALLEKNVADLQKLLQLKNQTLADLQKGNDVKTSGAGVPMGATPSTPASSTGSSTLSPAAMAPVPTTASSATPSTPAPSTADTTSLTPQATTPPAATPAVAPPTATTSAASTKTNAKPAPATATEPGLFEQLMDNTMMLIGVAILLALLIGYGLYTMLRRRKLARFEDSIFVDNSVLRSNSLFGTTGGQSVDTANTGFHSNFVPVAGNLPEQNEVDPVAEADVYIAYGRDAQAEEILREALRADPSRHAVRLKLLEIYAKRGDSKTFETMASELYAETGGQGEEWKQASALGMSIDPHNPLYREMPGAPVAAAGIASFGSGTASSTLPVRAATLSPGAGLGAAALGTAAAGLAASHFDMRNSNPDEERAASGAHDLSRTDPMPRFESPAAPGPVPAMDLDFNLGLSDAGVASLQADAGNRAAAQEAAAPHATRIGGLDFDVGETDKPMVDPFTASAFGASDPSARTAVNLPAFRVRAEQEPEPPRRAETDSFTASDIFGSSISGDMPPRTPPIESHSAEPMQPVDARPPSAPHALDSQQFEKTEPFDAFSNVNLDLDSSYQATELRSSDATRTDVWQAMATKLDLAMAYRDIGDTDGARELLEEVVRSGDSLQSDRARQLIGDLG